jgi:hypothetical protein
MLIPTVVVLQMGTTPFNGMGASQKSRLHRHPELMTFGDANMGDSAIVNTTTIGGASRRRSNKRLN